MTFRLPGPLAITVAQIDQMSGGRVELGLGTGWFDAEHTAYGIPFPPLGERFAMLEEQLAIITGLWTTPEGERVLVRGQALHASPTRLACPSRHSGRGRRSSSAATARSARHGSRPPTPTSSTPAFDTVSLGTNAAFDRVRAAVEAAGRPADLDDLLGRADGLLRPRRRRAQAPRGGHRPGAGRALRERGLAGTPAELIDKIRQFAEVGTERIYLQVLDLDDIEHLELIAAEVLPAV